MWIEGTTVGHLVDRAAERSPDADAVVFPDTRTTYGELSRLDRRHGGIASPVSGSSGGTRSES